MTNPNRRVETFAQMVKPFVKYLPDMDVAMNRLDQPRIVVPWDEMQALLAKEVESRQMHTNASVERTTNTKDLYSETTTTSSKMPDPKVFDAPSQPYITLAAEACPPDSHARDSLSSTVSVEYGFKEINGGFVTNFNLSSDLCTVGPEIKEKHGFLFAASSMVANRTLPPVFG